MSTQTDHDPIDLDRDLIRTTAASLGIWLAITFSVVLLLILFGGALTGLFV